MRFYFLKYLLLAVGGCPTMPLARAGQPQTLPDVMIPIRMPGDLPTTLPGVAGSSGLPLTWEVATGPATVSGNVVTLTGGLGPVTLKATQPGNGTWDPLVGHVCFSVTEEGGFKQVCRRLTNTDNGSTYGLTRTGRLIGFDVQLNSTYGWVPIATQPGRHWRWVSPGAGYKPHAIAEDGSLWHKLGQQEKKISVETDWVYSGPQRRNYAALRQNGTVWRGDLKSGSEPIKPPTLYTAKTRWSMLSPGLRIPHLHFPRLDFMGGSGQSPQPPADPGHLRR